MEVTTISPGEASAAQSEWKQIEADTTKASITATAATLEGTAYLINEILNRFKGKEKKETGNEVEIQVGREKVFRGKEGELPIKDTLTPKSSQALLDLIRTPSSEKIDLDSSSQSLAGSTVTIKVNKEPVLRMANGSLENHLEPYVVTQTLDIQAEPAATAESPELEQNALPGGDQAQLPPSSSPEFNPQPNSSPEFDPKLEEELELLVSNTVNSLRDQLGNLVPETVETQESQIPETPPLSAPSGVEATQTAETAPPANQRSAGAGISQDLAKSFRLNPETQKWLGETGKTIQEMSTKTWDKVTTFAKTQLEQHQIRQVASTALKLLDTDPQGREFQAEGFKITALDRHTISVADREGQEILRFKETALGPKILEHNLSPRQIEIFNHARHQLSRHGVETVTQASPESRLGYLQDLAPRGDQAAVKAARDARLIGEAESILNHFQTPRDDQGREAIGFGNGYQLTRQGDTIEFSHQDRGLLLSRKDGAISGTLTAEDAGTLRTLGAAAQQLTAAGPSQATPSQTTPTQALPTTQANVARVPAPQPKKQVELVD